MRILENISLKPYNTFGVEASARYFVEISTESELLELLKNKEFKELPILFLGGGSNIFFTEDFRGLVIKLNLKGITEKIISDNEILVSAGAGENWHQFVQFCLDKDYGGLENLSLIPGNAGTCPIQNIGAYGVEIKDCFEYCKVLNLSTLETEVFDKEKCRFGYRDSFFKRGGKGKYAVLEVAFRLTRKHHVLKMEYGAVSSELAKMGIKKPTIQDVSQAVIRIRQSKLPDPKKVGNAGSFFKNPVVSDLHFDKLKTQFPDIQGYKAETGVKIPAGWLIEQCGWKGRQIGNVATHVLQSLVIVNITGEATGKEIFDFSQKIIDSVKEKLGVELEREVNVL